VSGRKSQFRDEQRWRNLTRTEQRVAELLVAGNTRQQIAAECKCSPRTVDTHRGHVMGKLGVDTEVRLVWLAINEGWVAAPCAACAVRAVL
jgi:DNA-binding CsgD family transcriptional regulator